MRIILLVFISLQLFAVEARIATWWDNRDAAVSFTMDDNFLGHLTTVAPALEAHGWRGTFFIIAGQIRNEIDPNAKKPQTTWAQWRELSDRGHEIGNHSMSHPHLDKPDAPKLYQREIIDSHRLIAENIGTAPLSFCWPFTKWNDQSMAVAMQDHLVERRYTPVYGGKHFTLKQANKWIDEALAKGQWHIPMLHAVGEKGYANLEPDILRNHLGYIASHGDRIWVDTFLAVGRYEKLRQAASLRIVEQTANTISLQLTVPETMQGKAWQAPVTVILDGIPGAAVLQGPESLRKKGRRSCWTSFPRVNRSPSVGRSPTDRQGYW